MWRLDACIYCKWLPPLGEYLSPHVVTISCMCIVMAFKIYYFGTSPGGPVAGLRSQSGVGWEPQVQSLVFGELGPTCHSWRSCMLQLRPGIVKQINKMEKNFLRSTLLTTRVWYSLMNQSPCCTWNLPNLIPLTLWEFIVLDQYLSISHLLSP